MSNFLTRLGRARKAGLLWIDALQTAAVGDFDAAYSNLVAHKEFADKEIPEVCLLKSYLEIRLGKLDEARMNASSALKLLSRPSSIKSADRYYLKLIAEKILRAIEVLEGRSDQFIAPIDEKEAKKIGASKRILNIFPYRFLDNWEVYLTT